MVSSAAQCTNAFLNNFITEEEYMSQPPGFDPLHLHHVCRLHRTLYGLKQLPRAGFHRLQNFLLSHAYVHSWSDPSLFIQHDGTKVLVVLIYVDDIIVIGNDQTSINIFINLLLIKMKRPPRKEPSMALLERRQSRSMHGNRMGDTHRSLTSSLPVMAQETLDTQTTPHCPAAFLLSPTPWWPTKLHEMFPENGGCEGRDCRGLRLLGSFSNGRGRPLARGMTLGYGAAWWWLKKRKGSDGVVVRVEMVVALAMVRRGDGNVSLPWIRKVDDE
ncbi:Retrovirus-related Pol polyprotein from transposon RE1-like protein [Drosera capensis]